MRGMLDSGSHLDLVSPSFCRPFKSCAHTTLRPRMCFRCHWWQETDILFSNVVKFCLSDPLFMYTSCMITACITPQFSMDILLGLPFLDRNAIVLGCRNCTAVCHDGGFDLLNSLPRPNSSKDRSASTKESSVLQRRIN